MARIEKRILGIVDGKTVSAFRLTNASGATADISDYGGTWFSLVVPDRDGKPGDVVLAPDTAETLVRPHSFFGVLVGRFANRIGKAQFTLNGKPYPLEANDGLNTLHGGVTGFDKRLWDAEIIGTGDDQRLLLTLESSDGESGYPGNLKVKVTYSWSDDCALSILYEAETDADTVINLTNHAYFNLSGHNAGSILDHEIAIDSDCITPIDGTLIPTGVLMPVDGTPFDLRKGAVIGTAIAGEASDAQLTFAGGFDHNYVLNARGDLSREVATLKSAATGRKMTVRTTKPGIQFYSGNFLTGQSKGKDGANYPRRSGLCLETQFFPDSPNKPQFPSCVLKPGETYRHETVYTFSTEN